VTKAEWPEMPLGEVTTKIGSGATPKGGKESYKSEGTPLIRSMNVYDLHFDPDGLAHLNDDQAAALDGVEVAEGDVLLNITGASVARCCLAPARMKGARVNQHVAIIRPCDDKMLGSFLAYLLVSDRYKDQLLSVAQAGATREALTKGGLEQFRVVVPPLRTQQRIAAILSAYDDLIETNTRRIAILEEMARRLYEEWFIRFRFPGHEAAEFDGDLPKGWRRSVIQDAYLGLFDGPHATPAPSEAGAVFLGIKNIKDEGGLDLSTVRHIADEDYPKWTKRVVPEQGDIVFTYEATLNRYALVPKGLRCCLGRRMALIRPKPQFRYFLYLHLFSTDWRQVVAERTLSGATVDRIPLTTFPSFPITLPPEGVVASFDDLVAPIFDLVELLRNKNANLRAQRDLLLPKLVSGEIDVSGAEAALEAAE